jgi:hypothetical protein
MEILILDTPARSRGTDAPLDGPALGRISTPSPSQCRHPPLLLGHADAAREKNSDMFLRLIFSANDHILPDAKEYRPRLFFVEGFSEYPGMLRFLIPL